MAGPGKRFRKGQSGNPRGRPKVVAELRDLARVHGAAAMKTLADVMEDEDAPPAARIAAATHLLDRGYGKPTQHIEATVNLLDKLSDVEQRALAAALEALAGASDDATGGTPSAHH